MDLSEAYDLADRLLKGGPDGRIIIESSMTRDEVIRHAVSMDALPSDWLANRLFDATVARLEPTKPDTRNDDP